MIGYTYLALRMNSTPLHRCDELKSILEFIYYGINYTSPIAVTNMYGYCPLPSNIADIVREKLFNVTCGGEYLLSPIVKPNPAPDVVYYYENEDLN